MEAPTLQLKKAINKGKIKKSLKNVLCRPDPTFWPLISMEHRQVLEKAIEKYKVDTPHFVKPHWNDLQLIPKEKRPKPPKLKRVDGILFGISECSDAVKSNHCAAIILEAAVNPRIIVQPILEACIQARIPVLCVSNLRTMCVNNFGIPTSCLGLKVNYLPKLQEQILEIAGNHRLPQNKPSINPVETATLPKPIEITHIDEEHHDVGKETPKLVFSYLYRTNKKCRAFEPTERKVMASSDIRHFSGQDFIEFSGKSENQLSSKAYMKMIVKKITNNQNRTKKKVRKGK